MEFKLFIDKYLYLYMKLLTFTAIIKINVKICKLI